MANQFHQRLPKGIRRPPLAIAHRGGALLQENLGRENTIEAFAAAIALGYTFLETDIRTTRDGQIFAFHDPDLVRVLGRQVRFGDLNANEVGQLRLAGNARIPSLRQLLDTFPQAVFNIDFKDDASVELGLGIIAEHCAQDRVVLASFSHDRLSRARRLAPHLPTSASRREVLSLRMGVRRRSGLTPVAFQIPRNFRGIPMVTRRVIRRAHDQGAHVHVWTVNDSHVMHELLDMGVDGIITDRPDVLKQVMVERDSWST